MINCKQKYYLYLIISMYPQLDPLAPEPHQNFIPNASRFSIMNTKSPVDQIQAVPKNSIDESLCATVGEQIKNICVKFSYVMIPRSQDNASFRVRNWDLWGPFIMCLVFAFFIDNSTTFMALIFSVFLGAIIVTFNIKVLGGKISYFQAVSILGYCICPIFVALMVFQLLKFLQFNNRWLRMILLIVGTVWSIFAARSFIGVNLPQHKKLVGLYPIVVFYLFIAVLMMFR